MIEDVEESILSLHSCCPLLNIIDDKHVDGLVETDEIVKRIRQYSISILNLEKTCADVKNTLLRIKFLATSTNGINQVSFTTTWWAIDKHWVELCCIWMFSNTLTYTTRKLIAVAFNIVAESKTRIKLRIEFLRLCSIKSRNLIDMSSWLRFDSIILRLSFNNLCKLIFLICNNLIVKLDTFAECMTKYLRKQVNKVLLQILIHKRWRYLNKQSLLVLIELFKDKALEPCFVLLWGNVLGYERKSTVPTRIRTFFHSY